MGSPVTSEDLAPYLITAGSAPCDKAESAAKTTDVLHNLLEFLFDADGNLSTAFQQALNEAGVGTVGGGGSTSISAPSGVTATSDRTTDVRITWNGVATATSYTVMRGTANDAASLSAIATVSTTTYEDTSAADEPGRIFYYAVRASNAAFNSGLSAIVSGSAKADDAFTPIDGQSYKEVTAPEGATTVDVELWGSGGMGGIVPLGTIIAPGNDRLGGGGGASGSYMKIVGVTVVGGSTKFYLNPGARGTNTVLFKDTNGGSVKAYATAGGAGGNSGGMIGVGGSPASSPGENSLGSGSVAEASTVGNAGEPGEMNVGGDGGAAVENADAKTAGAGGKGTTSTSALAGGNGRIILVFHS